MLSLKYHYGSLITDHLNNFQEIMNQLFTMDIKFDEESQDLLPLEQKNEKKISRLFFVRYPSDLS